MATKAAQGKGGTGRFTQDEKRRDSDHVSFLKHRGFRWLWIALALNGAAAAGYAGVAYALTGLMRAFPWHAAAGQVYLPGDILGRNGVIRDDIVRGRGGPGVLPLQARLALVGLPVRLQAAFGLFPRLLREFAARHRAGTVHTARPSSAFGTFSPLAGRRNSGS